MPYHQRFFRAIAILAVAGVTACSSAGSSPTGVADSVRVDHATTTAQTAGTAGTGGGVKGIMAARGTYAKTARKSWIDRDAFEKATASMGSGGYLLFVSNTFSDTVDIYKSNEYEPQNPNQAMLGQIALSGAAAGLYVDSKSNLWVVAGNSVVEYNVNTMPTASLTLNAPYTPQAVAVDSQGVVYVANNGADQNGNIGISVYAKGATTPYKTLSDPSFKLAEYPAVDSKGNVYLGYYDGSVNSTGVFKAGSSTFTKFNLSTNAYQPRIDRNGDLVVEDEATGLLDIYANGTSTPSSSIQIAANTSTNNNYAFFDLIYANNYIFTTSLNSYAGSAVSQYTYPGGTLVNTISHETSYQLGIVTAPAPPYPSPFSPM